MNHFIHDQLREHAFAHHGQSLATVIFASMFLSCVLQNCIPFYFHGSFHTKIDGSNCVAFVPHETMSLERSENAEAKIMGGVTHSKHSETVHEWEQIKSSLVSHQLVYHWHHLKQDH